MWSLYTSKVGLRYSGVRVPDHNRPDEENYVLDKNARMLHNNFTRILFQYSKLRRRPCQEHAKFLVF